MITLAAGLTYLLVRTVLLYAVARSAIEAACDWAGI